MKSDLNKMARENINPLIALIWIVFNGLNGIVIYLKEVRG
jgi:hypothetical protein